MAIAKKNVRVIRHDTTNYQSLTRYQERLAGQIATGRSPETIILTEHNHVYTVGRLASQKEIIHRPSTIAIVSTRRGGRVTYHGPGQLIVYPLLNLRRVGKDIKKYINLLEESIIMTLSEIGLCGVRSQLHPGVWVREKKIASIGIQIRRSIAFHGLAINVDPALHFFNNIIPCGVRSMKVTSIKNEGVAICRKNLENIFINQFKTIFNLSLWEKSQHG